MEPRPKTTWNTQLSANQCNAGYRVVNFMHVTFIHQLMAVKEKKDIVSQT